MKKLKAIVFVLAVQSAFACAPRTTVAPPVTVSANSWTDSLLRSLSLREKAAQMVWPTVLGDYMSEDSPRWAEITHLIRDAKVGGFTISVGSPIEVAAKLNAMQQVSSVPLLFGADLEAGAGYRARGGYFLPNAIDLGGATLFPPEMALGATRDTTLAYAEGRLTALEGRALGIHIAYTPILDVNNNPANPVINTRSFSENPAVAARLGAAFVRGLQDNGMIGTGKHFPGHGDTGVNSHLALPVVTVSRSRLDTVELVPFRSAIAAGVGAIMSFHGSMPALDSSGVPGTLSPIVLHGLLRDELGFRGIIISDAMDMRGVLDQFGAPEATKRAVAAGIDVLIQPLNAEETINFIVAGVREGRYTEARLDSSVRRILAAKERLGLNRAKLVDIGQLRKIVGDTSHLAVARTVAQRSITLAKDSLNQVPLTASPVSRILLVTIARRTDLGAGSTFNDEFQRRGYRSTVLDFVPAEDMAASFTRVLRDADSAQVVIISSYVGQSWDAVSPNAPQALSDFISTLVKRGKRPIVVAFGNPYFLQQVPSVPAYLVAWGGFNVSQTAAAKAILGEEPITGKLPITIPISPRDSVRFGTGIVRMH